VTSLSLTRLAVVGLAVLTSSAAGPSAAAIQEASKPRTHTVIIDASAFQQGFVTVNAGDTIVWTNRDLFPHTVTATNGSFDSKNIPAEKSWKYTPKVKGTFDYKCAYHSTMTGVLKVK
jgi:plastocyanin